MLQSQLSNDLILDHAAHHAHKDADNHVATSQAVNIAGKTDQSDYSVYQQSTLSYWTQVICAAHTVLVHAQMIWQLCVKYQSEIQLPVGFKLHPLSARCTTDLFQPFLVFSTCKLTRMLSIQTKYQRC